MDEQVFTVKRPKKGPKRKRSAATLAKDKARRALRHKPKQLDPRPKTRIQDVTDQHFAPGEPVTHKVLHIRPRSFIEQAVDPFGHLDGSDTGDTEVGWDDESYYKKAQPPGPYRRGKSIRR